MWLLDVLRGWLLLIVGLAYYLWLIDWLIHMGLRESWNLVSMELLRVEYPRKRNLLLLKKWECILILVKILHHHLLLWETTKSLTHVWYVPNATLAITTALIVLRTRILFTTPFFVVLRGLNLNFWANIDVQFNCPLIIVVFLTWFTLNMGFYRRLYHFNALLWILESHWMPLVMIAFLWTSFSLWFSSTLILWIATFSYLLI